MKRMTFLVMLLVSFWYHGFGVLEMLYGCCNNSALIYITNILGVVLCYDVIEELAEYPQG